MLDDGTHDAIVFDVDEGAEGAVVVELTMVSGAHKGEVISIQATGLDHDPLDLLGIPATITVTDGVPHVHFDR